MRNACSASEDSLERKANFVNREQKFSDSQMIFRRPSRGRDIKRALLLLLLLQEPLFARKLACQALAQLNFLFSNAFQSNTIILIRSPHALSAQSR